jgi:micrococcal nuclease
MKWLLLLTLTITSLFCSGKSIKVTRVIDGDTFEIDGGEKVRLVGINAPEIRDIYGEEAKQHLVFLVEGKIVDLEPDHRSNDRDRYSRLLRYVILDGVDINKQMVIDGFAFAYLKYRFDKEDDYKNAQLSASKNNNGIWGSGKKETIVKQLEAKENNFWTSISRRAYLIGALVVVLLFLGIYYYRK